MYISEGVLTARYSVLCDSRVCNICGKHTWLSERSIKYRSLLQKSPMKETIFCTRARMRKACMAVRKISETTFSILFYVSVCL